LIFDFTSIESSTRVCCNAAIDAETTGLAVGGGGRAVCVLGARNANSVGTAYGVSFVAVGVAVGIGGTSGASSVLVALRSSILSRASWGSGTSERGVANSRGSVASGLSGDLTTIVGTAVGVRLTSFTHSTNLAVGSARVGSSNAVGVCLTAGTKSGGSLTVGLIGNRTSVGGTAGVGGVGAVDASSRGLAVRSTRIGSSYAVGVGLTAGTNSGGGLTVGLVGDFTTIVRSAGIGVAGAVYAGSGLLAVVTSVGGVALGVGHALECTLADTGGSVADGLSGDFTTIGGTAVSVARAEDTGSVSIAVGTSGGGYGDAVGVDLAGVTTSKGGGGYVGIADGGKGKGIVAHLVNGTRDARSCQVNVVGCSCFVNVVDVIANGEGASTSSFYVASRTRVL